MSDITRQRGDTYGEVLTVKNTDTEEAVNVAGCSFLLTVDPEKEPETAGNNLFQLTGTIVDAAAGTVRFPMTEEQADHVGTFFYDVQMTDVAGEKRTIARGKFVMGQDITKN